MAARDGIIMFRRFAPGISGNKNAVVVREGSERSQMWGMSLAPIDFLDVARSDRQQKTAPI
jgi:hypothetical protein